MCSLSMERLSIPALSCFRYSIILAIWIGLFWHINRSLLPYDRSLLTLTRTSGIPKCQHTHTRIHTSIPPDLGPPRTRTRHHTHMPHTYIHYLHICYTHLSHHNTPSHAHAHMHTYIYATIRTPKSAHTRTRTQCAGVGNYPSCHAQGKAPR